jgi:Putative 2OG-Fe(II) oxygenase
MVHSLDMTAFDLRWRTREPERLPLEKTLPLLRQAVAAAPDRADLEAAPDSRVCPTTRRIWPERGLMERQSVRGQVAGMIEFGPCPFAQADEEKLRPYRWRIRPEPGLLLLFPSYLTHRTWPTGKPEHRICVAFDVRPVGSASVEP